MSGRTLSRQNLRSTLVTGGAAGAHTVTGIAIDDVLESVSATDLGELHGEFTISAADEITNTTTDLTGLIISVSYWDVSEGI